MPNENSASHPDFSADESCGVWNRIAEWWDAAIGEGNEFQQQLIMPATDRLLNIRPGEVVLDAACGNGNYSRRLGRDGAKVVAFDGAAKFIECAKVRTTSADGDIEYRVLDATDESSLMTLGAHWFDAAVCNMAMMDLPVIAPLLRALRQLLKPGGRFVFSVPHPCFNSAKLCLTAEMIEADGRLEQIFGVRITEYLRETAELSTGIINQPEPHPLFHRPMHVLLSECFAAGFVVDGFEEPAFAAGAKAKNAFSWSKRPQIPPAIVVRVKCVG